MLSSDWPLPCVFNKRRCILGLCKYFYLMRCLCRSTCVLGPICVLCDQYQPAQKISFSISLSKPYNIHINSDQDPPETQPNWIPAQTETSSLPRNTQPPQKDPSSSLAVSASSSSIIYSTFTADAPSSDYSSSPSTPATIYSPSYSTYSSYT